MVRGTWALLVGFRVGIWSWELPSLWEAPSLPILPGLVQCCRHDSTLAPRNANGEGMGVGEWILHTTLEQYQFLL